MQALTPKEAQDILDGTSAILYPVSACTAKRARLAMERLSDLEKRMLNLENAMPELAWERMERQVDDAREIIGGYRPAECP